MVNFATFGIDRLWKRRILDLIPPNPERVLDLACGTGISTIVIAKRFPNCQVVGVELREEYLEIAKRKVQEKNLPNIELVLCRAEDFKSKRSFDCITSSYLAKYADLFSLTHSSKNMLKENGILIMHDFIYPPKPYLVWVWRFYFWLLQKMGTPLFPAWKEIYQGLPELIEKTRWIHDLTEAMVKNEFQNITLEYQTAYGSAIISARK
jgi:demethylmenaquinone methyltransferase/2-methoxy-6-polyprenyl-1,4-benzoquinol methylase